MEQVIAVILSLILIFTYPKLKCNLAQEYEIRRSYKETFGEDYEEINSTY